MTEKELRKQVTGKTFFSNVLLALKIVFDLLPQVLLVLVISSLFSGKAEREYFKMIAFFLFFSFML